MAIQLPGAAEIFSRIRPDSGQFGRLTQSLIGIQQDKLNRERQAQLDALAAEQMRQVEEQRQFEREKAIAEIAAKSAATQARPQEAISFEDRAKAGPDAALIPDTPEERAAFAQSPVMAPAPRETMKIGDFELPLQYKEDVQALQDEEFQRKLQQAIELEKVRQPPYTVPDDPRYGALAGAQIPEAAVGTVFSRLMTPQKTVERTVDLGDKVEYIYADGTRELKSKGLAPSAANTAGPGAQLTPKQTATAVQLANSLKTHPMYADMNDIATGWQGVQTGLSQRHGFGDIAAINAFQRMVDPGATVREGDVALLQSASALVDQILTTYPIDKLQRGDKLPEPVRQRMLETARQLYATRAQNYNSSVGSQYKRLAEAAGLPFELVGQDFAAPLDTTGAGVTVTGVRPAQ